MRDVALLYGVVGMKKDARHLVLAIVAVCAVLALAFVLAAPGTAGEESAATVRTITD
jgi:iron complex transport system substrate-binding protein